MFPAIHRNTRVIVDLKMIQKNIHQIKNLYPDKEIFAVVKANAYGHGMIEVAKAASKAGVTGFCVAMADEALALREAGIKGTILVLGITRVEDVTILAQEGVSVTVSSLEWLKMARFLLEDAIVPPLQVHVALDTGMGRIGVRDSQALKEIVRYLERYEEHFEFEGIFTHFAKADDADEEHLRGQMERYEKLVATLDEKPRYVHCSNTAYSLWHGAIDSNVIRYGIGLYGVNPSNEALELPEEPTLHPALTWQTEIVYVKQLQPGDTISYGATYTCQEPEWIATLPVGYADGYIRAYQGADVLVNGMRCPIVGRVCMDQCMIRIPHELPVGTTVTLLGTNGFERITAEELSHHSGTIGYEVLCLISDRVPRLYMK